jgi:hypothetical protein
MLSADLAASTWQGALRASVVKCRLLTSIESPVAGGEISAMTQATVQATETRERFLLAIAQAVRPERLVELYFFPPMRQGPIETGVAVIAAEPEGAVEVPAAVDSDAAVDSEAAIEADVAVDSVAGAQPEAEADELSPYLERPPRHVVFSARYRWTRKGPERGKWEQEIVAEADAPLITVEAVVQGVRRRAHEEFDPERMTGDEARALLAEAEERRCRTTP